MLYLSYYKILIKLLVKMIMLDKESGLNREKAPEFKKVVQEYKTLSIAYELAIKPCFIFGEISDALDIAQVYQIINLQFKDKTTGKIIKIADLVPAGFKLGLVKGSGARFIRQKKLITVPSLGEPGNQFVLLHEIGHAHQKRKEEDNFHKLNTKDGELDILNHLSDQEFRKEWPFEEQADKFAAEKLLEIRRQGLDLEPEKPGQILEDYMKERLDRLKHLMSLCEK